MPSKMGLYLWIIRILISLLFNHCSIFQACRGIWSKLLEMKDDMNADLSREEHHRVTGRSQNVCKELEARQKVREDMLMQQTTPVLEILLEAFKVKTDLTYWAVFPVI